ncbi:MAG: ATP-binding cassette domain-containing protein, partial [Erysipelotrichaceae bacterium]
MSQILCQNISFSYSRSLSPVFDHVNLQFDSNWKIGLVGRNGRGKTTLCSILTGKLTYQGSIEANQTFISFPFEIKDEQQSMHSWIQTAYPELETWKLERELQLLGVDSRIVERSLATYSLGEKTKMQLAMLFALDGVFPLLDEPTNHLDQMGKQ